VYPGSLLVNIENLVLWTTSRFNGFAGKEDERFWSTKVSKNSKSQITNIKQITMTKIQNFKPVLVI
jgi:hypothetical protein